MNQGLLWSFLMGCIANSVNNREMMERFSSARFSWPIWTLEVSTDIIFHSVQKYEFCFPRKFCEFLPMEIVL